MSSAQHFSGPWGGSEGRATGSPPPAQPTTDKRPTTGQEGPPGRKRGTSDRLTASGAADDGQASDDGRREPGIGIEPMTSSFQDLRSSKDTVLSTSRRTRRGGRRAGYRDRTDDIFFTREVLYQLS